MQNADFEKIVEIYGDMVYRIALTHILNKSSAEDIFQEAFLRLVKNIGRINDEEHLKFWLIRTTINLSKNANSRQRITAADTDDTAETGDDFSQSDLRIIIGGLPQKFREVIILCCLEGYTADEAAKILGKPSGTIKSRLYKARQLLKKEMECRI
ncbi:MAG: RNA polymerase sigma factor [Ruminococcus sp.]|nr:RNA polymerase sigma factor [Ruminococcus sp.]